MLFKFPDFIIYKFLYFIFLYEKYLLVYSFDKSLYLRYLSFCLFLKSRLFLIVLPFFLSTQTVVFPRLSSFTATYIYLSLIGLNFCFFFTPLTYIRYVVHGHPVIIYWGLSILCLESLSFLTTTLSFSKLPNHRVYRV